MNKIYLIPAFVAIFALIVFAPSILADKGEYAKWEDGKHPMEQKGPMGFHAIQVKGFNGTIQIPKEMTMETHDLLKSQITVSLSQAVSVADQNGFADAMSANIGIVQNQDIKYLAWIISSIEKNKDSQIITANIFVVDAGDKTNFAKTTQTFDHSKMYGDKMYGNKTMMDDKKHGDKMYGDKTKMGEMYDYKTKRHDQSESKFSEKTGNSDIDATKAKFLDLMQQLREAYKKGDTQTAQSIKEQLHELKQAFLDMRNSEF